MNMAKWPARKRAGLGSIMGRSDARARLGRLVGSQFCAPCLIRPREQPIRRVNRDVPMEDDADEAPPAATGENFDAARVCVAETREFPASKLSAADTPEMSFDDEVIITEIFLASQIAAVALAAIAALAALTALAALGLFIVRKCAAA